MKMPNWCDNTITIRGKTETIRSIWESANQEEGGLLASMVPTPNGEWNYDWCVENWGTKWDVDNEGLEFKDNDDDIPDIVPEIGYLDDAVVARWVIESIGKELPEVSLA